MATPKPDRQPFPDYVVDVIGTYFAMGAVGGSVIHFVKGIYNSPKGTRARHVSASHAVRINAPRVGGRFAVWGGLYGTFYCTLDYMRQKEDPWHPIIGTEAATGLFRMRQGLDSSVRLAAMGGILMGLPDVLMIMAEKFVVEQQHQILFGFKEPEEAASNRSETKAACKGSETKAAGRGSEMNSAGRGSQTKAAGSGSETEGGADLLQLFH